MIEVAVDSVRMNLVSPHRVVILKDLKEERYLPIWIGSAEANAISIRLQGVEVPRPLTHDLLRNFILKLGARVSYIVVSELRNDTFFARIKVEADGREMEIDSRPSDAIALAVRMEVPIYVAEAVMEEAGIVPEQEDLLETEEELSVFRDFVDTLDLEDLGGE
ncbi:MAG: bifunctional nuclease family protein [Chloroflexota bacterium]|nr:bifunctional nuclease family protein [Chloroflexota bacterium]